MNLFTTLDCMVEKGTISAATADDIRDLAKWLNGLQERDILLFIAAKQIINS